MMNKEEFGDWYPKMETYLTSDDFKNVFHTLKEKKGVKRIVPDRVNLFNTFKLCQFKDLKVVILGQDPYPQVINKIPVAHGLAFSSNVENFRPKSLENIFKEIESDLYDGFDLSLSVRPVNLEDWAKQGILLLNTSLTTFENEMGAHLGLWDSLIDEVFRVINENTSGVIFVLWGTHAKKYKKKIDLNLHYVLESGHPSPLSANKGHWFGNKHFSKINKTIEENNGKEYIIKWY
jgi:uracil-DNA glycosylase